MIARRLRLVESRFLAMPWQVKAPMAAAVPGEAAEEIQPVQQWLTDGMTVSGADRRAGGRAERGR
jgi:hypothetical protein